MSVPESNDDDELDIYSNLPNFHYDDSLQKLETKNKLLMRIVSELEKKIAAITIELTTCKREKEQLEKNISSLYKSAKQEITRKDKRISELTLREVTLKTRRRFPPKQHGSTFNKPKQELNKSQLNDHVSKSEHMQQKNKIKQEKSSVDNFNHHYETRSRTKKLEKTCTHGVSSVKCTSKICLSKTGDVSKTNKDVDILSDDNTTVSKEKDASILTPKIVQTQVGSSSKSKTKDNSQLITTGKYSGSDEIPHDDTTSTSKPKQKIPTSEYIPPKEESKTEMFGMPPLSKYDIDEMREDDEVVQTDRLIDENVHRPLILPEFHGPRTLFSIRRYKKLYGCSPLKDPHSFENIFTDTVKSRSDMGNISSATPCGEKNAFPNKFSNSVKKDLELSSNNCDSNDSAKSRLIDNLKLRRKVSNNVKSIVENRNDFKCLASNKGVSNKCPTTEQLSKTSNKKLSSTEHSVNSIRKPQNSNKNKIIAVSKIHEDSIVREPKNHISEIPKLESGCREFENNRNITVLYMETSVIRKTEFDYDNIEEDESFKCNKLPLTAKTSDLFDLEEEVELPSEDIESDDESGNIQQISDFNKGSKQDACDEVKDFNQDKIRQKKPDINQSENHLDKIENFDACKDKPVEKINQNSTTIWENELIKTKSSCENDLKSNITVEATTSNESCESFTLEMTNSPLPPDDAKSIDNDDKHTTRSPSKCVKYPSASYEVTSSCLSTLNPKTKGLKVLLPKNSSVSKIDNTFSNNDSTVLNNKNLVIKKPSMNLQEQQLKDLFGDSPSKSSDNEIYIDKNGAENDNSLDKTDPAVSEKQIIEYDKSSDLNLQVIDNCKNNDSTSIITEEPSNKNILITPEMSKSYSNFQEAFQCSILGIKKSDSNKVSPDGKSRSSLQSSIIINKLNNTIDKENPNTLPIQKSLGITSPGIKHILCDKTQNDCNINPNEKQSEVNQRVKEDSVKIDKVPDSKFSSELFGSEVKIKRSFTDLKLTKLDTFKISENSFLTSGDDSTLGVIKKYSKKEDMISPIKTPFKDFETTNICIKTDTILSRFSESSLCTENSTFNMIKQFSKIDNLVTPIKTPCKRPNVTTDVNESVVKHTQLQTNSDESNLTPTVIKQDGISICLSSEHCEFKRKRPIKKIIKFKMGAKINTSSNNGENSDRNIKSDEQNRSSVSEKPALKSLVEDENESEFCDRKKRKFVTNELPVIKLKRFKVDKYITNDEGTSKPSSTNSRSGISNKKTSVNKSKSNVLSGKISERRSLKRGGSVCRIKRNKSVERHGDKRERSVKKLSINKDQPIVMVNKYCHDINRSSTTNNGVCERRSPSEYFNQQQKSKLTIDQSYNWGGSSRSLRHRSPTPLRNYKKRKPSERKTSVERYTPRQKVKTNQKKVEYIKKRNRTLHLTNSEDDHRSDSLLRYSFRTPTKTDCLPVKRLSESPNVITKSSSPSTFVTTPNFTKDIVKEFMTWKMIPLEINDKQSCLVKRFISNKKMPEYIQKSKIDVTNEKVPETEEFLDAPKRDEVPSTPKQEPKRDEVPSTPKQEPKRSEVPSTPKQEPKRDEVPSTPKQEPKRDEVPSTPKQEPKRDEVPSTPKQTADQKQSSNSRSIIICKRIRRSGERKLEDSAVLTSNLSISSVNDLDKTPDDQSMKCVSSESDRNVSKTDEQELLIKKKQLAQNTRCIVKMPLDFKNRILDSICDDLDLELTLSSSEESVLSDESWRPKKSFKKRKQR